MTPRLSADSMTVVSHRLVRRASHGLRRHPEILVIGAIRAGTSALAEWLSRHPGVKAPAQKEVKYFDFHFHRGEGWYRSFFPIRRRSHSFDASPSYLVSAHAADRARRVIPSARVVVLLRDPVERAWSHFRLRTALGTEERSFAAVFDEQLAAPPDPFPPASRPADIPILSAGLYAPQLRPWLAAFGPGSVLVVESSDLADPRSQTLADICQFTGLSSAQAPVPHANAAPPMQIPDELRRKLSKFYEDPNRELADLLGRSFAWTKD